jgi:hypothetical protein
MFNNIDPFQQLQDLQVVVNSLNSDKMQLALAINHQAEALRQLNQQLSVINTAIIALDNQQKLQHIKIQELTNANT